jgi:signal peptidase II
MLRVGLRIAIVTLLLDQLSKWVLLFVVKMPDKGLIELTPNLNLRMVWNRGVSFGMFSADSESGRYSLIAFALVVVGLLLIWLVRAKTRLLAWAIGLVVGGAIGNVIDRVFYGAVADFFDVHALGYHFYTFNLADTAISLGVVLLIFEALFASEDVTGKKKATHKT